MVDGVLLDWEGVLVDTRQARRDSLLGALADEGVHFDAAAYDECCLGLSVQEAASVAVGAADPTLLELVTLRAQREFGARLSQGFTLRPGAAGLLQLVQLRAATAIVSEARRTETEFALRLAGLLDACAAVVTADDVRGEVPSSAQVALAIEHLARRRPTRRDHVIALVATRASIRAARAAGVRSIAIGAPAHVALEADGAISSLVGVTLHDLVTLAGMSSERHA
jgi:beta-phosphoglucomutase-like phosphatase (HAD superfamily)